jgi:AbiV family abortive infection protein
MMNPRAAVRNAELRFMCKSVQENVQGNETSGLDALVADVLAGKVSMFDLLGSAQSGDYWGFVQRMRLFHVLTDDRRILERFHAELRAKMIEAGVDPDNGAIERELTRKDGSRRFSKLIEERAQTFKGQPSLLSGATFEICLEQYKTLIAHVERMWADACEFYKLGNYPFATFFSILVIEEIGKLSRLAQDLIAYDMPRVGAPNGTVERNHRRKHFIGVVSGALINARLERVLGKDVIRKILHQAESDELEKIRQSCLYIDVQDGRTVIPSEVIDAERGRVFIVLAGELMAEVLGHFPWEFERMMDNVIAFERSIGMPEKKIGRR